MFAVSNKQSDSGERSHKLGLNGNTQNSVETAADSRPVFLGTIQRKASCACGGDCPSCQAKSGDLKVSSPNDAAEIEADQIADTVMRMPVSATAAAGVGESPPHIQPHIQPQIPRSADPAAGGGMDADSASESTNISEVLAGSGSPLEQPVRRDMEQRFGHDFSGVRVHTGADAERSAQDISANAYTVGNNIVFGAGQFAAGTQEGQRLLAHELTHVVQQSGSAGLSLQRQPSTGGTSGPPAPHITQIVVNQTTPQQVTATFSDGSTVSNECSTGKGHCCFDEASGTAEGGACSAARSTQVGNNCTPVGNFTVTSKVLQKPSGIEFWTQFHNAKAVALHNYDPRVDGTPLSHGCVRLHREFAETIFNGARVGVTRVRVENLARPQCEYQPLQREWTGDFTAAGATPPDGETISPRTGIKMTKTERARAQHTIDETREELRSALNVNDAGLDTEIAAVAGGASVAGKIPRCVPALTVEEQQVSSAQSSGFLAPGASAAAAAFTAALGRSRTESGAERVVRQSGEQLWQNATTAARAGGAGTDDRQLYWTRLMLTTALRAWNPSWVPNADALRRLQARLLTLLEQTSRGMTSAVFPTGDPDLKRILISGFDPFGFLSQTGDIQQSNLSGAATITLDGETLTQGAVSARIEGVVFPVRYADFDQGIVENHLRPYLTGAAPPHLVMSISQGANLFEFEESAGRRRSSGSFLDNAGRPTSGTETNPLVPPELGGDEFLRHSVPASMLGAMRGAEGRTGPILEETRVKDLPPGAARPRTLPGGPGASTNPAVEGAGGGFLSNEIFYRNSLLRTQLGSNVPMIHLHTPALAPGAVDATRNNFINRIREILRAAIPHL